MAAASNPAPLPAAARDDRRLRFFSLFLISFLALFYELGLIRWIPGCVKIIGYYTNLVLISSFLGLGLGCAQAVAPRRALIDSFGFRLLVALAAYALIQKVGLMPMPEFWGERVWDLGKMGLLPAFLVPGLVFLLHTWTFLALGRELGRSFAGLPPLPAYAANLAGSLAGTAAITVLGSLATPPLAWFAAAAAVLVCYLFLAGVPRKAAVLQAALLAGSLLFVYLPARGTIWSPYYKIRIGSVEGMMTRLGWSREAIRELGFKGLSVNDDYFQFQVNLNPRALSRFTGDNSPASRKLLDLSRYVQAVYGIRPPGRVLILGSGLGNDVAAALRSGAARVDAVEIDPVIIRLGRSGHPEKPYADPRVRVINTDARRFLRFSRDSYDTIVFAFLDSHTLFSAFSSVRLDNFVYTRESFRDAAARLSPDGILAVMFAASRDFVGRRLFFMVNDRFPGSTRALAWDGLWGQEFDIILAGPGLQNHASLLTMKDMSAKYFEQQPPLLPSDNWPFLYLERASPGTGYAVTLVCLVILSILITRRSIGLKKLRLDFFLLGAGFLLMETKSITEISLLFGSTWKVNSAVISAFLVMALLASLVAALTDLRRLGPMFAGLFATLLVAFLLPAGSMFFESPTWSGLAGSAVVALPVFFSGIIFAAWFKNTDNPALAIGSNILGATLGGFLEYLSLYTGMKALYVVAAILYAGAWFVRRRSR